ncbi:Dihydroorotate dehydrogenase (quinone) [invertebrate metagenome]|uniref:dihydroorotate dehydrogenase (quinone) n=1 Tax=invertebrate metagenome TaxID=1711999 RepID=A0A2H9T511_9ZZZZ
MGFNNHGIDCLVNNVKRSHYKGILGISIGKNLTTSVENAKDDYVTCFHRVYNYADYIAFNFSSPNTPGLRTLQFGDALKTLLEALKQEQYQLQQTHGKYVPVTVKIAPDMTQEEVSDVAKILLSQGVDGVIATNTTVSREEIEGHLHAKEAGGLSGAPLSDKSTEVIRLLSCELSGKLPIIGVGGIMDAQSAADKIKAGASLVQLYSGFIFKGPSLIREAAEACYACRKNSHKDSVIDKDATHEKSCSQNCDDTH